MKIDLNAYISEFTLRRLAGSQSYRLGVEYFHDSRVRSLREKSGSITASVVGAEKYRVQIKVDKTSMELEFSCSCPVGLDGKFCKHLVATGLYWLDKQRRRARGRPGNGPQYT